MRRIAQFLVITLIALLTASGTTASLRDDLNGNMLVGPPPSAGMAGRATAYDG